MLSPPIPVNCVAQFFHIEDYHLKSQYLSAL